MKSAIIVTEGRGQALHLREDANVNLLQAGYLASRFVDQGYRTHIRFVLDGGLSPEEYSLLSHIPTAQIERYRRQVESAPDRGRARRSVVQEIRERYLAVGLRARPDPAGVAVCDHLFFSPLVSQITEINAQLIDALKGAGPWSGSSGFEEYQAILAAHIGASYLDLEETVARYGLAKSLGDNLAAVDIQPLSRPKAELRDWLGLPAVGRLVEQDLAHKEQGLGLNGFQSRLIGILLSVDQVDGDSVYFNSPTCTRYEHGKVRVIARDRYHILQMDRSERISFAHLRELIESQNLNQPRRLLAIKYPYAAQLIAQSITQEAGRLAQDGTVKVVFVEGGEGDLNHMTGELIHQLLGPQLRPPIEYYRFVARASIWSWLPRSPGGLPLICEALQTFIPTLFLPALDEVKLFG
jgi:hypothetical protein